MAEPSDVRDKINTTIITIALTALGTISFQSAKYLVHDYWAFQRQQTESLDAKYALRSSLISRYEKFSKSVGDVEDAARERDKQIVPLFKNNGFKVRIDSGKVGEYLLRAHEDLGSIAYMPIIGTPLEPFRAAVVDELKSQIDALDIVEKLADRQMRGQPITPAETSKATDDLLHTIYHRAEARAAVNSSSSIMNIELDAMVSELHADTAKFKSQAREHLIWYFVAMPIFVGTVFLYMLLLSRITAKLKPQEISPTPKSADK